MPLTPEKRREAGSRGGKTAHQRGTAHEWTSEEARDAGRKGGIECHRRRQELAEGGAGASRGGAVEVDGGDGDLASEYEEVSRREDPEDDGNRAA